MPHLWSKLMTGTRPAASPRFRPEIEGLESRLVPTTYLQNGNLVFEGSSQNDSVTLIDYGGEWITVIEPNRPTLYFNHFTEVWGGKVFYYGNDGDDYFDNQSTLRAVAQGGNGTDFLYGGPNNDTLDGGNGMDWLYGRGGDDYLYAGMDYSVNFLFGEGGNDFMLGGYATDYMYGGADTDWIYGRGGNDYLYGEGGMDYLYGEWGNDTLDGGDDGYADYLEGGPGADRIQQDWVWRYNYFAFYGGSGGYWYNQDWARDFNSWDGDSYYG